MSGFATRIMDRMWADYTERIGNQFWASQPSLLEVRDTRPPARRKQAPEPDPPREAPTSERCLKCVVRRWWQDPIEDRCDGCFRCAKCYGSRSAWNPARNDVTKCPQCGGNGSSKRLAHRRCGCGGIAWYSFASLGNGKLFFVCSRCDHVVDRNGCRGVRVRLIESVMGLAATHRKWVAETDPAIVRRAMGDLFPAGRFGR